jgi:hypothetical protein
MNDLTIADFWHLPTGSVMALRPACAGTLRVNKGRAWATFDMLPASPLGDAGDHFVLPGQDLVVRAGQRVVVEALPAKCAGAPLDGITLLWEPVVLGAAQRAQSPTSLPSPPKRRLYGLPLGRLARP